jgi:hypothetical protein
MELTKTYKRVCTYLMSLLCKEFIVRHRRNSRTNQQDSCKLVCHFCVEKSFYPRNSDTYSDMICAKIIAYFGTILANHLPEDDVELVVGWSVSFLVHRF